MIGETTLQAILEVLPEVRNLEGVPQDPKHHPEGDAFTHTLQVVAFLEFPEEQEPWEREALWLAALLHDIGKAVTTVVTDSGRITSHDHAKVGAEMAEEICSRIGVDDQISERVVSLVKDHMRFADIKNMGPKGLRRLFRLPHFRDLLALHRADKLAGKGDLSAYEFCKKRRLIP